MWQSSLPKITYKIYFKNIHRRLFLSSRLISLDDHKNVIALNLDNWQCLWHTDWLPVVFWRSIQKCETKKGFKNCHVKNFINYQTQANLLFLILINQRNSTKKSRTRSDLSNFSRELFCWFVYRRSFQGHSVFGETRKKLISSNDDFNWFVYETIWRKG